MGNCQYVTRQITLASLSEFYSRPQHGFWGVNTPPIWGTVSTRLQKALHCAKTRDVTYGSFFRPRMCAGRNKQRVPMDLKGRTTPKIVPFYLGIWIQSNTWFLSSSGVSP